jgi:hypothetical protein
MEIKGEKSFLKRLPSWVLAVITLIIVTIVLFGVGEGVGNIFKINEKVADAIPYIIFDVLIAVGCFYIVKWNPKSIWYVPIICNVIGIIAAIVEPSFWKSSLWILICGGWVLSIITSIIGARVGKKSVQ